MQIQILYFSMYLNTNTNTFGKYFKYIIYEMGLYLNTNTFVFDPKSDISCPYFTIWGILLTITR